jgi:hypothetical protein
MEARMSLTRKQMQILAASIKYRLDILKVHISDRHQLLDGLKLLIHDGKMASGFYEPLLKILNYPNEVDKALAGIEIAAATKYVRDTIAKDLLELEAELNISEQTEEQKQIQNVEDQRRQEEEYLKRLVQAPAFVSCNIPKDAFDPETNAIRTINSDIVNAVAIGGSDQCGGLDDSEKLADVLLHGFNRPGLSSAGSIQTVLKFKNLYDLDFFRRNKIEGIKRVDKYYTPAPNKDFSGAVLLNKEARLKLCAEHNFADIQYHQIQVRRNEILRLLASRKNFLEQQVTRLTGLGASDTEKCNTFTSIRDRVNVLTAELGAAPLESLTQHRLEQYGVEVIRMDDRIRDNSTAHRDTGVKGFFAGNAFRMPKSYEQFEESFSHPEAPRP